MHAGITHVGISPDLDYAIVFDDGRVGLYFRSSDSRLVANLEEATAIVGELKEYKKNAPIKHRPMQVFPVAITISDDAMRVLEQRTPKPEPSPPSPRERLAQLDAERKALVAELDRVEDEGSALFASLEREREREPVGPAVVAAAAEVDAAAAAADELEPAKAHPKRPR
jgi:hypothetical protein